MKKSDAFCEAFVRVRVSCTRCGRYFEKPMYESNATPNLCAECAAKVNQQIDEKLKERGRQ